MDRLTFRDSNGNILLRGNGCSYGWFSYDCYEEGRMILKEALDKLAEYEDLEEQGLLQRFPCKPGDLVHIIDDIENVYERSALVESIEIEEDDICIYISDGPQTRSCSSYGIDEFGEVVFCTEEEARQKLKENCL